MNPLDLLSTLAIFIAVQPPTPNYGRQFYEKLASRPQAPKLIEDKGKSSATAKFGTFAVCGVGTVKDKEIVVANVAFLFDCPSPPANGKVISFAGSFDGKTIHLDTWQAHRSVAKRTPFLDFAAVG